MEKALFDRLNRLFKIAAAERSCDMLLSAQNLRLVTREPQPYVLNILPRRLPKEVVVGEHFVLPDLPFYAAVQRADARTRKTRLNNREEKRKEGLLRKAPGGKRSASSPPTSAPAKKKKKVSNKGKEVKLPTPPKKVVIPPSTYVKEVTIREPKDPVPPSISSGPEHLAGLNHSGPSQSVAKRLALLAKEGTSINQPGSPHPDADVGEASCAATSPLSAPPREEVGSESQGLPSCGPNPFALVPAKGPARRRSCPARDLKSGLLGRVQDRFLETIEVNCSFVQDDHPEENKAEMAAENPPAPVVVPDGGSPGETQPAETARAPDPEEESLSNASSRGNPVDDAACISASAFSYVELEEKLKRIPPGSNVVMPSTKIFEVVETI